MEVIKLFSISGSLLFEFSLFLSENGLLLFGFTELVGSFDSFEPAVIFCDECSTEAPFSTCGEGQGMRGELATYMKFV